MAADVGHEGPVAFRERRDHGIPTRPGVGEAVQEDDVRRHQIRIMTATDTYLLLRAFCDELARCGMEHACTSPGSRCTPIVLSLVREPRIHSWSHLDERCAGFFALGAAKSSGRPVAVTCTSGTAAANLTPAVIESRHARVPLIVLTADRPPELREVGAGQTIDQIKLYGDAVKWFFEVGVHEADPDSLRWIRTLACRAYWTAAEGPPGPVHLNFPLREPLVLDGPLPEDATGRGGGRPYVTVDTGVESVPTGGRQPFGRIVIVAGAHRDAIAGRELAGFAERAAIPLLADPLSGARHGKAAIAHYDLLLRDPDFSAAHRPEFVIRAGDLPTSKPLRAWLAGLDADQIAIDPDGDVGRPGRRGRVARAGLDPRGARRADRWRGSPLPARMARLMAGRRRRGGVGDLGHAWRGAVRAARRPQPGRVAGSPHHAVRGLLDADPRRRGVPARPRGRPARALQPRRQRDRRHGVDRLRRGGRRTRARWCC